MAYCDRDLLVDDQVFQHDFRGFVFYFSAAFVAILFLYFFQFFDDDAAQLFLRTENGFVFRDVVAYRAQFFGDFID